MKHLKNKSYHLLYLHQSWTNYVNGLVRLIKKGRKLLDWKNTYLVIYLKKKKGKILKSIYKVGFTCFVNSLTSQ